MKLSDRFAKFSDEEHLEFERIPESERLHPSEVLCGFLKVSSLLKDPASFEVCAGYDMVYVRTKNKLEKLTDEDIVYLLRCGIMFDTESGMLAYFC